MRKVVKKFNRALSVLLVAAMVVGMTPDVCLTVNAEETAQTEETATVEETVDNSVDEVAADAGEATPEEEPVQEEQAPAEEPAPVEEQAPANDTENAENTESSTPAAETTASESVDNTTGEEEATPSEPVAEEPVQEAPVVVEEPVVDVQEVVEEPVDNGDASAHGVSVEDTNSAATVTADQSTVADIDYSFTVADNPNTDFTVDSVNVKVGESEISSESGLTFVASDGSTVFGTYTIASANITDDITITIVSTANTPAQDPSTTYKVKLSALSNPNVKVWHDKEGTFTELTTEGVDVEEDNSITVKVDKIEGVDVSLNITPDGEDANSYYYYIYSGIELSATAKVDVNITTDDDAKYDSITFANETPGLVTPVVVTASENPDIDLYGWAELEYGATYDVVIGTSTGVIVKTLKINGESKYTADVSSPYTFTSAVKADKEINLSVTAAENKGATFTFANGETVKYADNAKLDGSKEATTGDAIEWNGKLYFTVESDTHKVTDVKASYIDEDNDTFSVPVTVTDGVYSVDVTNANTSIAITSKEKRTVTINGIAEDGVSGYSWSRTADGTFTTYKEVAEGENLTDIPSDLIDGDKLYLRFTLAATEANKTKVAKVTSGATLLEDGKTWEVTIGASNTIEVSAVATTEEKRIITFSGDVASIAKITYTINGKTTELAKTADAENYDFDTNTITDIADGTFVKIKVELTTDAAKISYIKTIGGKTPNANGEVTVYVDDNKELAIALGTYYNVSFAKSTETNAECKAKVEYKVGEDGEYKSVTLGTEAVKSVNVEEGSTVYVKVTPEAGNKAVVTVDGNAQTANNDGLYEVTTAKTLTISTVAATDVTFKVNAKKMVTSIDYIKAPAKPEPWSGTTNVPFPTSSKIDPSKTVEDLEIATDENIYFMINVATGVAVKSVKIGDTPLTATDDVYTIENSKLASDVTVDIETTAEYSVTVDTIPAGFTVKDTTDDKNEITAKPYPVNSGEKFDFTVTYNYETHKLDTVIYSVGNTDEDQLPVSVVDTKNDDTAKTTTVTYSLTPETSGTLTITGHEKQTVAVTFDASNAKVKAAEKSEDVSTAAEVTSINTIKEDGTVYFSVTADKYYKVVSVQYKETAKINDEKVEWTTLTASDEVYSLSLADITAPQTVKVVTARDEETNNAVVFDADMNAITVVEIPEGNTLYTDATSATVTLKVNPGYKVTEINVSGVEKPLEFSEETLKTGYPIAISGLADLTKADATPSKVTVTVKTEKIALADDKDITISASTNPYSGPLYSYDVVGAGVTYVEYDEDDNYVNKYTIAKGTTDFNITVVVNKDYEPSVSYDSTILEAKGTPVKVSDTKVEYTFNVLADTVESGTITISASPVGDEIKTETVKATIKVAKTIDGVNPTVEFDYNYDDKKANSAEFTTYVANYVKGEKAVIYVSVPENHSITVEGLEFVYEETVAGKDIYKAYIAEMTADVEATITASEDNILTVLKNNEEVKPNNKGVYSASKGDVFTVSIQTGSKTGTFTDATVAAKGVTFAEEDIKNANGTVTFTVPEAAAGKTVTLTVSYGDTSKSYKIAVAKAVKKVTVKGAKQGVITQTLDTTAAYQITGTKDLSVLYTEVAKATENGVEGVVANFDLEKGVLNITTPKAEGSAVVTIKSKAEQVAVLDKDGKETDETEDATLATITVTSVAPTLKMGKVDTPVILDNSVTLNMIADKNTKKVNGTDLQYKIEVTPSETYKDFTKPAKAVTATTYADVQFDDKGAVKATSKVVNLINVDQGKGQVWEFTVKVSLVQKDGTKDIAISEKAIEKKVVTKAPYYEDKLTLKKGTTTVYTGQQNVVVATPKFSKNATYQGTGTALVYNSKGEIADDVYAQWTPEGTIVVSVYNEYASIGSYTLKVIPDADKDTTFMYAAPATMKINVVRGIYRIEATEGNIYKAANKAVTYNMNVKFNEGSSYYKPKTAKATYEVGKMVYGEFVADKELAKYISVKNGKISIKKNYKLAADPEDNKFAVKVTAADYKENTLSETFVYKVTGEKAQMGTLYLAKYVNDKYYLPEDNTFTTDEFPQYGPIMLKAGVEAGRSYYTEDDVTFDFDISFSNKKVYLFSYNNHTIAKNVTMTATAADGSKAKSTYKFNLEYNKATLGIAGFNTDDEEDYVAVVKTAEGKYEFNANTADDTITFNVGTKNANGGYDNFDSRATYNYKVSVKGGKIVSSSVYEGKYTVVPTAQKMTITLQDKSTGKAVNTKYELTNKAFIKVKPANVTLSQPAIYEGIYNHATLTFAKTDYDYAYITYDTVDYNKVINYNRNSYKYDDLVSNANNKAYSEPSEYVGFNQMIKLSDTDAVIKKLHVFALAHNYKLNVTFGNADVDGNFVPATKAKAVKIAVKAVTTFKPTAKYTMDAKVGSVTLTGKPAELANVAYANAVIENANVKGQPNNFTKIFAYVDGKLVLQQNAATKKPYTAEELAAIPKTDLTGYVTYWNEKTDTYESAKITVNFKAVKYTATAISVMADKAGIATGTTTIMNGKTPVSVGKVYAVCDKAEFTAEMKEGKLTVASKAAIEAGKYAIKLYVVESDAYYTSLVTNAETAAQYGTEVKLQFTVLNPVKGKVKFVAKDLKVKFDANDYIAADKAWSRTIGYSVAVAGADVKGITLTDAPEYYTLAKVADANAITVSLDKDKLVAAEAAKETNKSLYKATSKAKLSVEFNNGETETIAINLTAAAKPQTFAEAVDIIKAAETKELKEVTLLSSNESKWEELLTAKANSLISKESGAVATVTGEKVTLSVDNKDYFIGKVAVVNNDKGADAKENYTSENIKWAITDAEADTTQEVADALDAVMKALVAAYGEENDTLSVSDKLDNSITEANVLEVIKKAVTDKNINVRAKVNITPATEKVDGYGKLDVTITLSRSIWTRYTDTYTVYWDKLNTLAEAVTDVTAAFGNTTKYTLTNESTEADVIAIANAAKNNPAITIAFGEKNEDGTDNENFRIGTKADAGTEGSILGTLIFSQEGKDSVKVVLGTDATVTIKAWDTAATAATAIPTYVLDSKNFTATNATSESDIIAAAKAAIYDPEGKITIEVKPATGEGESKVEYFKKTEATVNKEGSVEVTLVLKVGEATTEVSKITLTIAKLPQTVEEAAVVASKAIDELVADTTKTVSQSTVKSAVEAVVGCTVAVQNYKEVAATTEAEGSITFDVKLSNSSEAKDYVIISKTITLPKVAAPTS